MEALSAISVCASIECKIRVEALIVLLMQGSSDVVQKSVSVIADICKSVRDGSLLILKLNGVKPLVNLLKSGTVSTVESCAAALTHICSSSYNGKLTVANVGGFEMFARVLECGSTAAVASCIEALKIIMSGIGNVQSSFNLRVEALITLLWKGTPEVVEMSMHQLCQMYRSCENNEDLQIIIECCTRPVNDFIASRVSLGVKNDGDNLINTCRNGCEKERIMGWENDVHDNRHIECRGLHALDVCCVHTILDLLSMRSPAALLVLYRLSTRGRMHVVEAGGAIRLINMLKIECSASIQMSIEVLALICMDSDVSRYAVLEAGTVEVLVKLLLNEHECTDGILMWSATVLCNLCLSANVRRNVMNDTRVIPGLVNLMSHENSRCVEAALCALNNICIPSRGDFDDAVSGSELCPMVLSGQGNTVIPDLTNPMMLFAMDNEGLGEQQYSALLDSCVVGLISLLSEHPMVSVQKSAAACLGNLCLSSVMRQTIVNQGGIHVLVTALEDIWNADMMAYCTRAICNLCTLSADCVHEVVRAGAIKVLIVILKQGPSIAKANSTWILSTVCNVCSAYKHNILKTAGGSIRIFVELLSSGIVGATEKACLILIGMCQNSERRSIAAIGMGVVEVLLDLFQDSRSYVAENSCGLLSSVLGCCEEYCMEAILKLDHGLPALVFLLQKGTIVCKERSAIILRYFTKSQDNFHKLKVVEAKVVAPLVSLVCSGSEIAKRFSTLCLCDLLDGTDDNTVLSAVVEDGGIDALSAIEWSEIQPRFREDIRSRVYFLLRDNLIIELQVKMMVRKRRIKSARISCLVSKLLTGTDMDRDISFKSLLALCEGSENSELLKAAVDADTIEAVISIASHDGCSEQFEEFSGTILCDIAKSAPEYCERMLKAGGLDLVIGFLHHAKRDRTRKNGCMLLSYVCDSTDVCRAVVLANFTVIEHMSRVLATGDSISELSVAKSLCDLTEGSDLRIRGHIAAHTLRPLISQLTCGTDMARVYSAQAITNIVAGSTTLIKVAVELKAIPQLRSALKSAVRSVSKESYLSALQALGHSSII